MSTTVAKRQPAGAAAANAPPAGLRYSVFAIPGEVAMPVVKVTDLAYGRLRSPDLDKQEEFLTTFGMVRAERTKNALYMRGTDAPHHIHVTELGEPKYFGIAFHAKSEEDLDKLSRVAGASKVEDIDE